MHTWYAAFPIDHEHRNSAWRSGAATEMKGQQLAVCTARNNIKKVSYFFLKK
jgi:hypothetical protein